MTRRPTTRSVAFSIELKNLEQEQIWKLFHYSNHVKDCDSWIIDITGYFIEGSTEIDNGCMKAYMNTIGIPEEIVAYEYD